jgi:hypothetical protein
VKSSRGRDALSCMYYDEQVSLLYRERYEDRLVLQQPNKDKSCPPCPPLFKSPGYSRLGLKRRASGTVCLLPCTVASRFAAIRFFDILDPHANKDIRQLSIPLGSHYSGIMIQIGYTSLVNCLEDPMVVQSHLLKRMGVVRERETSLDFQKGLSPSMSELVLTRYVTHTWQISTCG